MGRLGPVPFRALFVRWVAGDRRVNGCGEGLVRGLGRERSPDRGEARGGGTLS
jgi:hypothetical protein